MTFHFDRPLAVSPLLYVRMPLLIVSVWLGAVCRLSLYVRLRNVQWCPHLVMATPGFKLRKPAHVAAHPRKLSLGLVCPQQWRQKGRTVIAGISLSLGRN